MALTPSNMMPLGTKAPDFTLLDVRTGIKTNLQQLQGRKATVIMFICNHCPFVKHINEELANLGKDFRDKGAGVVAISSNDVVNYPEDAPEKLKAQAETFSFNFPYLFDSTQEVAKAYDAACTPDFYIFDGEMQLQYRGQLDDSRPGNGIAVSGKDLRFALNAIIKGEEVPKEQKPSIGCNIKWK